MTEVIPGLHRVGAVVVLTGPAARTVLDLVLVAIRSRQRNGMPASRHHVLLAQVLGNALTESPRGSTDVRTAAAPHYEPEQYMTVTEAADALRLSHRQVRRLASRLGGRKSGRDWLLDRQAVIEHQEGK